jgi:hypothetical protein
MAATFHRWFVSLPQLGMAHIVLQPTDRCRKDTTFEYKGEIAGANTKALEGVPTMDKNSAFFFISI